MPRTMKSSEKNHKKLEQWVKQHTLNEDSIIICGVWNCCLNDRDRNTLTHLKVSSRINLKHFIDNLTVHDVWHKFKSTVRYTWSNKEATILSRLDYSFASNFGNLKSASVSLTNALRTDHKAIIAKFELMSNKRVKGTWKPRVLRVSVATRSCRDLIFASSWYLSVIYLFPVMIHWWVRKPSRGPNNCMIWAMIEAEAEVGIP